MKFTLSWLKEHLETKAEIDVITDTLTNIGLEVENIEDSLAKAKKNGLEPIGEAPRPGADNTLVAFFHPKDTGGVLLEIVEEKS